MKLIIEIPEEVYEKQRYSQYFGAWSVVLQKCFENGIPFPKGHGRLIDADDIDNHIIGSVDTRGCPTIIEADKAEKE